VALIAGLGLAASIAFEEREQNAERSASIRRELLEALLP
jgi:cysteine sulfinate desulfinase/cysteine desulfurase-like protein